MMKSKYIAMDGILLAFSILPALVNGYDCKSIGSQSECSKSNGLNDYSTCMVGTYSISALIQCANQNNAPIFTANTDSTDGTKDISAAEVLTYALQTDLGVPYPGCTVPLTTNIPKAAHEHGSVNFGKYLCNQYHPLDSGLCGLRLCLLNFINAPEEHSIEAFCSGDMQDLMKAPTLPDTCGGDPSHDVGPSAAASSSDASSSTDNAISTSSGTTQPSSPSTVPTTSPTASSATPPSSTTTSPTPQATQSTGAASRGWGTGFAHLIRLGLIVIPLLAVF